MTVPNDRRSIQDADFFEDAEAWIRDQVTAVGAQVTDQIARVHLQPWSTVMRVPTNRGLMFFKANHGALRHEAAAAVVLSSRRPDVVAPLVAVDVDRGWMLMNDAGTRLREWIERERTVAAWLDVLPLYAGLQLDLCDANDELIALGVPDLRAPVLVQRFEAALDQYEAESGSADTATLARARAHVPRIAEMSDELAALGIPDSIQHDDLNDGQVYFHHGGWRVLDWGDACISHPLYSMSVALEGVVSWGVDDIQGSVDIGPFLDAYLRPFADRLGKTMGELRSAAVLALRLGWACRTANGQIAGDPGHTLNHLQMLLDGRVPD